MKKHEKERKVRVHTSRYMPGHRRKVQARGVASE
jgi:hypothetical protein